MSLFRERYKEQIEKQKEGQDMLVSYRLQKHLGVVPLKKVIDVVIPEKIRPVLGAHEYFAGLFLYEERPIVLIDVAKRLGIDNVQKNQAIILQIEGMANIGFLVEGIIEIIPYDKSYIIPLEKAKKITIPPEFIDKVFHINKRYLVQLNTKKALL